MWLSGQWSQMIAYILGLFALGTTNQIVKLMHPAWDKWTASVHVLTDLGQYVVLILMLQGGLLAQLRVDGEPLTAQVQGTVHLVTVIILTLVFGLDIYLTIRRASGAEKALRG